MHNYEWFIDNQGSNAVLCTGTGQEYAFAKLTNGTYEADGRWSAEDTGDGLAVLSPEGIEYFFSTNGSLESVQDSWGNQVICSYNTNNCLDAVTHSNGRQLLFSNEWQPAISDWRVNSVSVSKGPCLQLSYNADGLFTQIVETVGTAVYESSYRYADGFLTNKVNGAGHVYSFGYQTGTDGKLNGKGTSLNVDGWIGHTVDYVDENTTDMTYTLRGLDQIIRYSRNSFGKPEFRYGSATNISQLMMVGTRYSYATNHIDKTEETLFDNNTSSTWSQWMLYDDVHNITNLSVGYNTTNPVYQMSMEYEPLMNQVSAITDADGDRTELVYTNGSMLAYKTFYSDTASYDTHFSYTTNGLLAAITNARGHVTQLDYNAAGGLVSVSAEVGPVISNSYNSLGFVSRREILSESGESTGRITQMDRDAKGRVTQVVYPDELTASYQYNALDYLTNVVDRAGRVTELAYAPTRKLTSVTRYLNQSGSNIPVRVSYDYDEQFNTLSITEPRGRYVESYQLDIQDRVTSVTNIENQVMTLDYSIGSFVTNITRFDQLQMEIAYDTAGRQSSIAYIPAGGSAASLTVSRDYYADGQLKSISDAPSSISNSYDRLNRLTDAVSTIGSRQSSIANAFDPAGNLTNSVVFFDTSSTNNRTTAYSYDVAERLIGLTAKEREKTQNFAYSYNPENGRVSSITNLESGLVTSYAYDLMDRTTNISYTLGTNLIRSLDYEFDAVGMITDIVTSDDSSQLSIKSYQYDSLDRLINESRTVGGTTSSSSYAYDLAGNRTAKVSNGWKTETTLGVGNRFDSTTTTAVTNSLFISGSANELIGTDNRWGTLSVSNLTSGVSVIPSVNGNTFAVEVPSIGNVTNIIVAAIRDRAGNVGYSTNDVFVSSSGGTTSSSSYSYDAAGCLTNLNGMALNWDERYRLTSVDEASSLVSYTYDVLGRRTSCSVGSANQTNTEYYVYNSNQIAADLDESGNLLRSYVWGPGIDNLLAFTDHTTSNTYYAIKDHQNTVLAFVDESGSVVESYEYDAWGNTKVFSASGTELTESAIDNRYTFQGREIDWVTGLIYFRARWYDSETGRWLSKDPIGISGGLNLYAFCSNNPVNFIDPSGLCETDLKDKDLSELSEALSKAKTDAERRAILNAIVNQVGGFKAQATMAASMLGGNFSKTIDTLSKMADVGQLTSLSIQAQQQSQALDAKANLTPSDIQQGGMQQMLNNGAANVPFGF